jgi:hypothetical protein
VISLGGAGLPLKLGCGTSTKRLLTNSPTSLGDTPSGQFLNAFCADTQMGTKVIKPTIINLRIMAPPFI